MSHLAIDLTEEARNAFMKLRTSSTPNHSFVLRPDAETLRVELEAEYPEGKSLDDIAMAFPSNEPRFVIIMPERLHPDGIRKSYPIILCCYCPPGLAPQVNVVYSNARTLIAKDFQLNLVWEVHKKLALGDEELKDKLDSNKW